MVPLIGVRGWKTLLGRYDVMWVHGSKIKFE